MTDNSTVTESTSASESISNSSPIAAIEADTSTIITVDDDGNGDFTTIAEAIAQSGESSTIRVTGGEDNIHAENDIVVDKSLSITGDGNATIDAALAGRVFNIQDNDATTQQQVSLSGLTITAGTNAFGGGIFNAESLILEGVTLSNSSSDFGSGLYNAGAATIRSSTIANNAGPTDDGSFSLGGGIFNAENATLTIENSTIANNNASIGGGIYSQGGAADTDGSTDSGDTDIIDDALIIEADESGSPLRIENSTIANNNASVDGAGLYVDSSASLFSTLVADNLNNGATGNDLSVSERGSITAERSLIESNADLLSAESTNNLTSVEPRLDPNGLQDNGGATQTIALLSDSPARDQGSVSDGLSTDQRGAGFNRVVGAAADIGAFEISEGDDGTDEPRSFRTDEDTSLTLTRSQLIGDSEDEDNRQVSINALSALGATIIDNNDGTFTYNPVAATALQELSSNGSATDSFTVTVEGDEAAETAIEIQVSGLNDAPVFTSAPAFSVVENVLDIGSVIATDVESQGITYSVEGDDADALTIDAGTGALRFNQAPDFESGNNSFTARVVASDGESTTGQDITVAVTDVDETDDTDNGPISVSFIDFSADTDDNVTRLAFGGGSDLLGNVDVSFSSDAPEADASFDNLLGFYEIADANGGIDTNGDGVADVLIGDAGYAEAALNNRIDALTLRSGRVNTNISDVGNVSLAGDRQFAAMVLANGGEQGFDGFIAAENAEANGVFNDAGDSSGDQVVYFSFLGANPDGANHLKHLGNNVFGFEDMSSNFNSDNDFNDATFKLDFAA